MKDTKIFQIGSLIGMVSCLSIGFYSVFLFGFEFSIQGIAWGNAFIFFMVYIINSKTP